MNARAKQLLVERIRQCVPLHHPAFGKLLQLVSIEITTEVPTAAVSVGASSRLKVNPDFMARHCRSDEHLSMLVMHELYHVLLGHTRLYRRPTLAANWAFDCIINAQLCRLHPTVEYTSFFSALAAEEGPWSLIAPAPGWPRKPQYADGALGDVHRRLYDDTGVTTEELFGLLDRLVVQLSPEDAARLLGSHEDEPPIDPLHADPDLMAEVRRIVGRWPMVERRGGLDDGGDTVEAHSHLQRDDALRRAVARLLRSVSHHATGRAVARQESVPIATPILQGSDRRAQLQRLVGSEPLWWQGQSLRRARSEAGRIRVYLDVSGSMQEQLPPLLDALSHAATAIEWPLQGFSTVVHPLERAELAAGRFHSTGGTHIACVAQDLIDSRARRAVIFTDGAVQEIPAALLAKLRRQRPRVAVGLLDAGDAGFCASLRWPATRLSPGSKEPST